MRQSRSFPIDDPESWKSRLFQWASTAEYCAFLDSNGHRDPLIEHSWDVLAAAGALDTIETQAGRAFDALRDWQARHPDWLFGGFGYDLKNEIERLHSTHSDGIGFPDLFLFQPETVAGIRGDTLEIHCATGDPEAVFETLRRTVVPAHESSLAVVGLQPRMSKPDYLRTVEAIREHIAAGDLYEMNFCQEFFADGADVDPAVLWAGLNKRTRAPMSAYLRWRDHYLVCASPERFLKKEGPKLISQPIKGTRPRAGAADEAMRRELAASEKDRAENVMIVDLVRNDLSRTCVPGTVRVEELFGIHTFETVHQMISTVSGILRPGQDGLDGFRAAFPPGSMTGAPKVMSMELIERYENMRRGLYAGSAGYFDPAGDFDFNVVIRSIFYHGGSRRLCVRVGGAIVFDSLPEGEYEECLVKANALFAALGKS